MATAKKTRKKSGTQAAPSKGRQAQKGAQKRKKAQEETQKRKKAHGASKKQPPKKAAKKAAKHSRGAAKKAAKKASKSKPAPKKTRGKPSPAPSKSKKAGKSKPAPKKTRGKPSPAPSKSKKAGKPSPAPSKTRRKAGKPKPAPSKARGKAKPAPKKPVTRELVEAPRPSVTQTPPAATERPAPGERRPRKRRPRAKVYTVPTASPLSYSEGDPKEMGDRAMISSSENSIYATNYAEALSAWFANYCGKALVGDPDTVPVWRYGVLFTSEYDGQDASLLVEPIRRYLQKSLPSGWVAHVVPERGEVSVRIGLGSYEEVTSPNQAMVNVWENEDKLSELIEELSRITGGGFWFAFMDVPSEYASSEPPHGEPRRPRTVRESSRRGRGRGWNDPSQSGPLWDADANRPGPIRTTGPRKAAKSRRKAGGA